MLAALDRLVDKVLPRAEAGACLAPIPCSCKNTTNRCIEGINYHYYYSGETNCLGKCSYGTYCKRTAFAFC